MARQLITIFVLLTVSGCSAINIGDGKCFGRDCAAAAKTVKVACDELKLDLYTCSARAVFLYLNQKSEL